MFNRSQYAHAVTMEDLLAGCNAEAVRDAFAKKRPAGAVLTEQQGLAKLNTELARGDSLFLNGKKPKKVTQQELEEWFGVPEAKNFLINFSQEAPQFSVFLALAAVVQLPKKARLTLHASQHLDSVSVVPTSATRRFENETHFYYDEEEKSVYCEGISYVQLAQLPGSEQCAKMTGYIPVYSRFKLRPENDTPERDARYELIEIRTNSPELAGLLAGNQRVLDESFNLNRWNWKAIGRGVLITLGVLSMAAIVAGAILFPPSLALTLPYFGTLLSASPLTLAGAGLIGVTAAGFLTHQVTTSQWFKEKSEQVHPGWKWAARAAIGLGVALMVAAAVFFPPSLVAVVFYGGAALASLTAIGHFIHIVSKPGANDHKKMPPPVERRHSGLCYSSITTTASVSRSLRNAGPDHAPVVVPGTREKQGENAFQSRRPFRPTLSWIEPQPPLSSVQDASKQSSPRPGPTKSRSQNNE